MVFLRLEKVSMTASGVPLPVRGGGDGLPRVGEGWAVGYGVRGPPPSRGAAMVFLRLGKASSSNSVAVAGSPPVRGG